MLRASCISNVVNTPSIDRSSSLWVHFWYLFLAHLMHNGNINFFRILTGRMGMFKSWGGRILIKETPKYSSLKLFFNISMLRIFSPFRGSTEMLHAFLDERVERRVARYMRKIMYEWFRLFLIIDENINKIVVGN